MSTEDESFILQCRANWFLGIRPADKSAKSTEGYKALIKIAQQYFSQGKYEAFSYYGMEGQYLIPLWTAHLILEYGQPLQSLRKDCLEVIHRYTDNPLAPDVAEQEKEWLDDYYLSINDSEIL